MELIHKQKKEVKEYQGVSLLETIVVIGISVVLFFIITNIFINFNRLFQIQSATTDVEMNNYLALNRLQKIIKESDQILASKIINSTTYSTSNNTLVLEAPSIDSGGNIIPGSYDFFSIHRDSLDQSKLILSAAVSAGSSRRASDTIISAFVDKLIFSYNDIDLNKANLITIYLANSRSANGAKQTTASSTAIGLRNQP
jgi:competence protein ComGC